MRPWPLLLGCALLGCTAPSVGTLDDLEGNDVPLPKRPASGTEEADAGPTARTGTPGSSGIAVALAGPGTGTVTSSPAGVTCDAATCKGTFPKGTAVTLTATPSTGATFSAWGGGCTGTKDCAVTVGEGMLDVTATFIGLDGTWTGTYTNTRPASNCTFTNGGNFSVTIAPPTAATPGTLPTTATMDGLEIRSIPSCVLQTKKSSTTTANVTVAATTVTGTWAFAIAGTNGPPLPFPFTATVTGNTMTGTWTCANCQGSFTLTKP